MVNYRRDYTPGALYFFTLTLKDRKASYLTTYINDLGKAFRHARKKSNFATQAIVVLPDHIHFLWKMPVNDSTYSKPIRFIKTHFTQALLHSNIPLIKNSRGEYNLWQNRFWEHRIRDESDLQNHVDYIHYNPVKHGYVTKPTDWCYSSIHRYIQQGIVDEGWCGGDEHPVLRFANTGYAGSREME
jgi:putative transposase